MAADGLDVESLVAEARTRAGLADFGDEWFREPLGRMLQAAEAEASLSPAGRMGTTEHLVGILVNRLRVQADVTAHPEISSGAIERPIVILGLQRTGTTKLQRLMAVDPRLQHLPLWQAMNVAPFPDAADGGPDPRITVAEQAEQAMREHAPEFFASHAMKAHEAEEETMLVAYSFMGTSGESRLNIPTFGAWVEQADHGRAYAYMVELMRYLQWQNGAAGKPWLLKSPMHLLYPDALLGALPDVLVVHLHRDPVQCIPSLCRLLYHLQRMSSDEIDASALGPYWLGRMARGMDRYLDTRSRHEPDQFLDIPYERVLADGTAVAAEILGRVGLDVPDDVRAAMTARERADVQHQHGTYHYTAEDFGLSDDGIRDAFAGYRQRFGL
jgi:hypothetical protein